MTSILTSIFRKTSFHKQITAGVAELADARDLKSHTASPVENAENPCKISARRLNDGGFHRLIEGFLPSLKATIFGRDLHFDLHFPKNFFLQQNICWCGGIGRRKGLKILRTFVSYRFEPGRRHHRKPRKPLFYAVFGTFLCQKSLTEKRAVFLSIFPLSGKRRS